MSFPPNTAPLFKEITQQVASLTTTLTTALAQPADKPPLDFSTAPPDIITARDDLLEAVRTLNELVLGPADRLRNMATEYSDPATLRWIVHFKIASHVPSSGSIAYPALAAAAAVPVAHLRRILRYAMTNGIFTEPASDHVAHSPLSALLSAPGSVLDTVGHAIQFSYPVSVRMVEMTERWEGDEAKDHTAFNVAFETPLPMFGWLKGAPDHAARFARLMTAINTSPAYDVKHLVGGYEWAGLGGGRVVDVGGSTGHSSVALARAYPALKFEIQDLEYVVEQNKAGVPADVADRITFRAHDFFTPQPSIADVFLLRQILHDWPDEAAVRILRGLVPALERNADARVLVMDQVVPEPGAMPRAKEKLARAVDLIVLSHFNGKQRDLADWKGVVRAADERLVIRRVLRPEGSVFALLEVGLEDGGKAGEVSAGGEAVVPEVPAVDEAELAGTADGDSEAALRAVVDKMDE
ncbi:S-adenosyl-L-methionine-dependent methyltransferase [Trichodelitschia bisporula]|uniref:S-adenosyl-L-methionine-dependent methyltransferase n=1 Tax=Trichodelitschia bisporula TaxID=703511 RepID=A0A6G1HU56_9PEZI|nr:S-adenosyl-L-methionine-dependent methyltransferase [Trichodelitschia bisporula]